MSALTPGQVLQVPVGKLLPDPNQPRKTFSFDLRPYGPNGSMVCFDCATSTPEREEETTRNFCSQLDACGHAAVIDGSHVGPYPLSGEKS